MKSSTSRRWGLVAIGAGLILLAPAVYAQGLPARQNQQQSQSNRSNQAQSGNRSVARPPSPERPDNPPVWLFYIVAAGLTGGAVAVSILPSKRGHQD